MKKCLLILLISNLFLCHSAQLNDSTIHHNRRFQFQAKQLYIPVGLMVLGSICEGNSENSLNNKVARERNRKYYHLNNHVDDYAQFAPFVAIYGFEFAGMAPRTDIINRTAILAKGQLLNLGLVYILKNTFKQPRPDGTTLSFPSGHTANVFAGATMLSIEYGDEHRWVPYASYALASGVGVMRIVNNKHYISDVLFGAGLGILSMKVAYWTHQYKWNQTKSTTDPFAGVIY